MIFLELDGRRMNIKEWARELGLSHQTVGDRMARGLPLEEVLSPKKARRGQRPRSADAPMVARAKEVLQGGAAGFASPWDALAAKIVCQAIADWPDRMQRTEVERFFRGSWFGSLCGLDGEEIVRRLRAGM